MTRKEHPNGMKTKMNIKTMKTRKGFTLVELLVVIAIIVALAALATPQIFKALKRAALAEALNTSSNIASASPHCSPAKYPLPSDRTAGRYTGSAAARAAAC